MKYDAKNRLIRVDTLNGTERYAYNHKNLRVWTKSADGAETFNFYQGTNHLASYTLVTDAAGNLSFKTQKINIYFGKRLAQSGGEVQVADRLGSTRAWSAKKGAKTASYTPFGERVQGGDSEQSKFDGYEEDVTTGLKYAEQRYYSSTLGRFMTPDPYEKSAKLVRPESWNRYAFVANDPINRTDPHGLNSTGYSGGNNGGGGGSWGHSGYTAAVGVDPEEFPSVGCRCRQERHRPIAERFRTAAAEVHEATAAEVGTAPADIPPAEMAETREMKETVVKFRHSGQPASLGPYCCSSSRLPRYSKLTVVFQS